MCMCMCVCMYMCCVCLACICILHCGYGVLWPRMPQNVCVFLSLANTLSSRGPKQYVQHRKLVAIVPSWLPVSTAGDSVFHSMKENIW